jgi:hypothetical protein
MPDNIRFSSPAPLQKPRRSHRFVASIKVPGDEN